MNGLKSQSWPIRLVAFVCTVVLTVTSFIVLLPPITAEAATYRSAKNSVSSSYKESRYYDYFSAVKLTGDGVTDLLAVAISQLGYQEGNSAGSYGGESSGSKNYTEYYYNFGMVTDTYSMAWCAAYVSWALYQSQNTNQKSISDMCRNHLGNKTYIWREISCPYWVQQLQKTGYYSKPGSYTPKSGDLIFFKNSGNSNAGHIGIVVWCDGSKVYTIEGNTSSGTGVEANGGGVYYKSYSLTNERIHGYGKLPLKKDSSVPKVDYSGKNRTEGLYITKTGKTISVAKTAGGAESFTIPAHRMFEVTGFSGSYGKVEYNGKVGYAKLTNAIQFTRSDTSTELTVHSSTANNAGGNTIPEKDGYRRDPNVLITGLAGGKVNSSFGLDTYGNNEDLILINGRSLSMWRKEKANAIKQLWIRSNGKDGQCYLGFDLASASKLWVYSTTTENSGEPLRSIVLKRGFQFVTTKSDTWGKENLSNGSVGLTEVLGTLEHNIVLVAKESGGFDVIIDGMETKTVQGDVQYGEVTGTGVNVRSAANTSATVYGTANKGDKLQYLGVKDGDWYKVKFNGKDAWIIGTYFKLTGYEMVEKSVPIDIDGYVIETVRDVVVTASKTSIRKKADASSAEYGTVKKGTRLIYEKKSGDWYKVRYNGKTGWILIADSKLESEKYVNIEPMNAPWQMVGIDVSKHNGTIDWEKVKKSGVQFAMLRLFGHVADTPNYTVDSKFEEYLKGATAAGIHVGGYFFSYAKDLAAVEKEAKMVVDLLNKYPATFKFPIVFDAETGDTADGYDITKFAGDACATFKRILEDAGYYVMVYANTNWYNNVIDSTKITGTDLWQAHYKSEYDGYQPRYGNAISTARPAINKNNKNVYMWQYTEKGAVPGISGDVDLNICSREYHTLIPSLGKNGFEIPEPETPAPETPNPDSGSGEGSGNGEGTGTDIAAGVRIVGASVALGENIAIRYYVSVTDSAAVNGKTISMRIKFNGETFYISDSTVDINGYYVFEFGGITYEQMSDNIIAELLLDDTVVNSKGEYSVARNLKNRLAKEEAKGSGKDAALIQLIYDLLMYGQAAQIYTDYNTGNLAGADINGSNASTSVPDSNHEVMVEGNSDLTLKIVGAGICFEHGNRMYVEIYVASPSLFGSLKVGDREYTLAQMVHVGDKRYKLYIKSLSALDFGEEVEISLFSHSAEMKAKMTCSAYSYAYDVNNNSSESAEMKTLATNLYRYGKSLQVYCATRS